MSCKHGMFAAAFLLAAGAALPATQSLAQAEASASPGSASGHYADDTVKIEFTNVTALAMDDAGKDGDADVKMRVVLADRPVPPQALMGGSFPPVWGMGKAGEVRGIMLEFDPADRTQMSVVVLAKPDEPDASLVTVSLNDSTGLWKSLTLASGRVTGRIVHDQFSDIDLTFDAPVATNRVVNTLTGPAAQGSEFVSILKQRTQAIVAGDLETFARLSTKESFDRARAQNVPKAELEKFAKLFAPYYDKVQRVVIREYTAEVIMPEGLHSSFVKEDGVWKCAD